MINKKISGFYHKEISRRKFISGLLGIGYLSTSAVKGALSLKGQPEGKSIVIDDDYVIVDGWLLRTDDLFQ